MKQIQKLSLAAALLAVLLAAPAAWAAAPAQASDWEALGGGFAMQNSSIATEGKYVSVWVMRENPTGESEFFAKAYKSARTHYYFDCPAKTYAIGRVVRHAGSGGTGEVVKDEAFDINRAGEFGPVKEHSVVEALLGKACATVKTPAKK